MGVPCHGALRPSPGGTQEVLVSVIHRSPISPRHAVATDAVRYLASACDGAVRRDGYGFSSDHVAYGYWLAELPPDRWSPAEQAAAHQLVLTYRYQLAVPDLLLTTSCQLDGGGESAHELPRVCRQGGQPIRRDCMSGGAGTASGLPSTSPAGHRGSSYMASSSGTSDHGSSLPPWLNTPATVVPSAPATAAAAAASSRSILGCPSRVARPTGPHQARSRRRSSMARRRSRSARRGASCAGVGSAPRRKQSQRSRFKLWAVSQIAHPADPIRCWTTAVRSPTRLSARPRTSCGSSCAS